MNPCLSHSISGKDIFLDVLDSSATRRDAKSYLKTFEKTPRPENSQTLSELNRDNGVNLGRLYTHVENHKPTTHVALVKIRDVEALDDDIVQGVGRTISQLAQLGMTSVVVLSPSLSSPAPFSSTFTAAGAQVERIIDAIQASGEVRAQGLEQLVEVFSENPNAMDPFPMTSASRNQCKIVNHQSLFSFLHRGIIPVISSIGICPTPKTHYTAVPTDQIIRALVREMLCIPESQPELFQSEMETVSLDRIIILDPLGGIPAHNKNHGPHTYINLEQEFTGIKELLSRSKTQDLNHEHSTIHQQNLELLMDTLMLLPPSSSGIIATPLEVAKSQSRAPEQSAGPRVRTRRQRNTLIHNLLTDKPAISSSLPYGRFTSSEYKAPSSTFLKRGMPVEIIPDPSKVSWPELLTLKSSNPLSDGRIDVNRLVRLIENSFGRELDVTHYFARIRDRFAGLVVAGEYEGCALFTWESPPSLPEVMVPYLDKFAVTKRSQGAGTSVADVLFKAMVRDCFPEGVCWRSRSNNPVNKWYFERAKGTWKIPGTKWAMFWTTENATQDDLKAYEAVCRHVTPSWAD